MGKHTRTNFILPVTAIALICAHIALAGDPLRVYTCDFTGKVGSEWSSRSVESTPAGHRPFLGLFGGESVTFHLDNLPDHQLLRLSFALYIINPVDGNSPIWGPDIWDLSIDGGATLLHSTFDNCGFFSDNNEQSFPDEYPARPHPGWCGADEKQTLGYVKSWGGPQRTFGVDSVYNLHFAFPHAGRSITLNFTSFSTETKDGEAWGLASFKLDAVSAADHLDAETLNHLWNELASDDPVKAFRAKWSLVGAGADAESFLLRRLECDKVKESDVAALVDGLEGIDSAKREQATSELLAMGDRITPALLNMLSSRSSPESSSRLGGIARMFLYTEPSGVDALRRARAFHALEVIQQTPNPARRGALALPPWGSSIRKASN